MIDVALYEAVFNVMESLLPEYSAFGAVREAAGSALPGIAPSNAYRCTDGYVLIAGNGDSIFKRLMQAIGRDDLGADARRWPDNAGRVARVDELDAAIEAWTLSRPVAEVLGIARRGAGAGRQGLHRQGHRRGPALPGARHDPAPDHARRLRARRARHRAQAARARRARCAASAPRLGDDTDAVLRELGFSTARHRRAARQEGGGMTHRQLWNGAGRRIHMQEVGTRDGLQVETAFVPTEDKIALVNALSQAGMAKIEVTAFVSPKAIPALRDAEIVLREIERRPGRGLQRAGAQRARRRARDRGRAPTS